VGRKKVRGRGQGIREETSLPYNTIFTNPLLDENTDKMAAEGTSATGTTPGERHAIGISFGNSNSSIAYTTIEDKAEVIANEDGGMLPIMIKMKSNRA